MPPFIIICISSVSSGFIVEYKRLCELYPSRFVVGGAVVMLRLHTSFIQLTVKRGSGSDAVSEVTVGVGTPDAVKLNARGKPRALSAKQRREKLSNVAPLTLLHEFVNAGKGLFHLEALVNAIAALKANDRTAHLAQAARDKLDRIEHAYDPGVNAWSSFVPVALCVVFIDWVL
jgi:hypothetical protein